MYATNINLNKSLKINKKMQDQTNKLQSHRLTIRPNENVLKSQRQTVVDKITSRSKNLSITRRNDPNQTMIDNR